MHGAAHCRSARWRHNTGDAVSGLCSTKHKLVYARGPRSIPNGDAVIGDCNGLFADRDRVGTEKRFFAGPTSSTMTNRDVPVPVDVFTGFRADCHIRIAGNLGTRSRTKGSVTESMNFVARFVANCDILEANYLISGIVTYEGVVAISQVIRIEPGKSSDRCVSPTTCHGSIPAGEIAESGRIASADNLNNA